MLRPPVNPKFIPNVTQIPNVVIDKIMRDLSPAEFKVFCVLVRKTFGWGQESEYISMSQFVKLTGLTDTGVSKALKSLQQTGLVQKMSTGGGRTVNCWSVSLEVTFRTYPSGRRYVINSSAIPNILFDEIMAIVSPAEFKALLLIARKTYGFHKDTDKIARSQFELFTGLSEPGIKKVLRSLQEKQLIHCLNSGGGRNIAEWTINTGFVMPEYRAPNRVSPCLTAKPAIEDLPKSGHPVGGNRVAPRRVSGSSQLQNQPLPTEYPPEANKVSSQNKLIQTTQQKELRETKSVIPLELAEFPLEIQKRAFDIARQVGKENRLAYVIGICRNLITEKQQRNTSIPALPLPEGVKQYASVLEIRYRYGNKLYLQAKSFVPEADIRQSFLTQGIEVIFLPPAKA